MPTDSNQPDQSNIDNKMLTTGNSHFSKARPHFPFDCPPHSHHPYSEFRHLSKGTKEFALSLSSSTDRYIISHELNNLSQHETSMSPRRLKIRDKLSTLSSVYQKSLQQTSTVKSSESSMPCKEKPCLDMIQAVAAARNLFKVENADIQSQFEDLSLQFDANENQLHDLQAKHVRTETAGDALAATLKALTAELDKLVSYSEELIVERESFSSKFIHLEYKLQNYVRQHQDASAELYGVLWGDRISGSSRKDKDYSMVAPSMVLHKPAPHGSSTSEIVVKCVTDREQATSSSPSVTSYSALAREDIVDTSERLPPIQSRLYSLHHIDTSTVTDSQIRFSKGTRSMTHKGTRSMNIA